MSNLPPLGPCQAFRSGHQTHWIMAKRSRTRGRYGTVTGFDGNHVLVQARDGQTYRWWHHHPRRLRLAVEQRGTRVKVFRSLPAIQVDGYWFFCSTQPSPCVLGSDPATCELRTITDDAYLQENPTYGDVEDAQPDPPEAADT